MHFIILTIVILLSNSLYAFKIKSIDIGFRSHHTFSSEISEYYTERKTDYYQDNQY